jgi:hypothetical protein
MDTTACSQDTAVMQKEVNKMRKSMILVMLLCIAIAGLSAPVQATTTEVDVVKYASDDTTILNTTTVNYTWMEANLAVEGDGVTQGLWRCKRD